MREVVSFKSLTAVLAILIASFFPSAGEAATMIVFTSLRSGVPALYTMDSVGGNVQFLSDNDGLGASEANWSFDGTRIAFVSGRDVWVMNADGSSPVRLTTDPALDRVPSISPDGTRIVFTSDRDGNSEIYLMDIDGANESNLTRNSAHDGDPEWSPDGNEIVFHSRRGGTDEVHIMDANGGNVRRITAGLWAGCSSWSPDGDKIAFGALGDIWVVGVDGGGPIRLTSAPGQDNCPTWSVNGSQIVFHSERDGNREIYRMDADGANQVRLTFEAAADDGPDWSPFVQINAPVDGSIRVTGIENSECDNDLESWTLCQHQSGGHSPGGGVLGADDTFAWDVNLVGNEDAGRRVFPVAEGRIVRYSGECLPCSAAGALLVEHKTESGETWWSGYAHMVDIRNFEEGDSVTGSTVLGRIGAVGADTEHLHFAIYRGENIVGGLVSIRASFGERIFTDGFESGDVGFWGAP